MSLVALQKIIDSGETYYYHGKPIVVKSFDQRRDEIEILVEIDGQPQKFIKEDEKKIGFFIEALKTVPEVRDEDLTANLPATKPAQVPVLYLEMKDTMKTLTDKLIADIDKVREDPNYVPQAKQVCNNVSAIVNITRLQLQLLQNG